MIISQRRGIGAFGGKVALKQGSGPAIQAILRLHVDVITRGTMCSTDRKRLLGQCFTPSAFDHTLTGDEMHRPVGKNWLGRRTNSSRQQCSHSPLVSPSVPLCPRSFSPSFLPSIPHLSLCPCLNLSLSLPPSIPICLSSTHLFPRHLCLFISVYLYIYIYLKRKRGIPSLSIASSPSLPPLSPSPLSPAF